MSTKEWREANKAELKARSKAWYEANKERDSARRKEWRDATKDAKSAYDKEWREANRGRIAVRIRERNDAESRRTPVWANIAAIEEVYRDAAEFRGAGLDVHVDHIIPLRAKLASGLHVHQNLTIKLASWNIFVA